MAHDRIATPKDSLKPINWLKPLALLLLAAAILWWLGRGLNWVEVQHSFRQANWKLLFSATVIVSLTYLLRAYRWRALLAPLSKAGLRDLFVATVGGFSAMFLVGRSGEVVRPALLTLRDGRVRPAASFITIMVERICDLAAIILLFAINLIWFTPPVRQQLEYANVRRAGLVLLIAALIGLAALFIFQRRAAIFIKWFETTLKALRFVPNRVISFFTGLLDQLATALTVLTTRRAFLRTFLWTAVLWLAVVADNFLILRAFGVQFGLSETIFVLGLALLGSLVPTPGGAAGAFHAATAAGLIFLGATREEAAAIAVVVHLIDFAPALLFGIFYLLTGEITFSALRNIRPTSPKLETGELTISS